jgi:NADPH:quinone reductase-like Zn-dependent oxidoreductase
MKILQGYNLPDFYRAAQLAEPNNPLKVITKAFSPLLNGEVWIQMKASPINPSDLALIAGTYPTKKQFPFVPGLEGSGLVVASGGGFMANFVLGKRVACSAAESGDGTWAEYMKAPASNCIPLIKSMSYEQGASAIVNPITAVALIETVKKSGNQAFVNTAAAGALGKMMIRLAKKEGLQAINIVHRPALVNLIRKEGAEVILDSSQSGFETQLSEACKKHKATILLDAVGGTFSDVLLQAAPDNSTLVTYASLEKDLMHINPAPIIRFGKKVEGFHLAQWIGRQSKLKLLFTTRKAQKLMMDGTLASPIHKTFSLNGINDAIENYQAEMSSGKWMLSF